MILNSFLNRQWLTYWVVFACLSVFEFFSSFLLSIIPFYWLAKVIKLISLSNFHLTQIYYCFTLVSHPFMVLHPRFVEWVQLDLPKIHSANLLPVRAQRGQCTARGCRGNAENCGKRYFRCRYLLLHSINEVSFFK